MVEHNLCLGEVEVTDSRICQGSVVFELIFEVDKELRTIVVKVSEMLLIRVNLLMMVEKRFNPCK